MKRKIFFSTIIMAVLLVYGMPVSAVSPQVDMDYEGEVDIYTGNPITNGNSDSPSLSSISLPGGGSYDRTSHLFVYQDGGSEKNVQVTVADGMITTQTVSVIPEEGVNITLYRDGEVVTDQELASISAPGVYSVIGSGGDDSRQIMSFTIVSKTTGEIDSFVLPDGFYVTSILHNGKETESASINTVDLSGEGDYEVSYRCQSTGVDYSLQVTMDHIPPALTLEGVENNRADGPVTVSGLGEDESLSIRRDGVEVKLSADNVIKDSGSYEIVAVDAAGNVARKSFVIGIYLNNQGIVFFLLTVGIIAAAIFFMVYSKKKMRIR